MKDIENHEFIVLIVACAAHLQQHLYDLKELQSLEIKVLKKLYGKQPRPKTKIDLGSVKRLNLY